MTGAVSVSIGVFRPLLGKLTTLLGDEYKKLKGVRQQASFLRDELSAMGAFLEELELMDELTPGAKDWRNHVREMSYDMENCIDDLIRISGGDAKEDRMKKMGRRLKTLRERHRIAERMEKLKNLAIEANARRLRYTTKNCKSSSSFVDVDPRVSAIYEDAANLVGIDGPREQLVTLLTGGDGKLKVVSIVGFGGVGKTTLAKQVYDKIGGKFGCKAFFSVSQRPDITTLLNGLQSKLGIWESSGSLEDIIDRLRERLTHQRYLIVVDDLWDQPAWNIIKCAFPKNGNGSRVIVTTRVEDVASVASRHYQECIYRMKPLKEQDSRRLFLNRVFGSEDGCPSQLKQVSDKILKRCVGLPLAVITIASLLASSEGRSCNDWESIMNSLGAQFLTNPTLEGMRRILNLSYMHLPLHLRACFLYLGMFPEDHKIKRDDLVQQWVAEGFVTSLHGLDLYDVALSYFNELVNRSLIQRIRRYRGVVYCRVHDMMLDLIISRCTEDNFISVACNSEAMVRLHDCKYKVRRLSLNLRACAAEDGTVLKSLATNQLSQVRSLIWFGASSYAPPLLQMRYLQVLVLHMSGLESTADLTGISQLFRLRCLKISAGRNIKLPTHIRGLVYLETLELECNHEPSIVSDRISHLPRLSHVMVQNGLYQGISKMKSLLSLYWFEIGKSSLEDIKSLGKLTNLQKLYLKTRYDSNLAPACVEALVSSIKKLRNLKIFASALIEDKDGSLCSLSDPPPHLEELRLVGWKLPRVPTWIGDLHCLCRLMLTVMAMSTKYVQVLGELPSLVVLVLWADHIPKDRAIFGAGSFPALESLDFMSHEDVAAYLGFQSGAMPKLRKLLISFEAQQWGGATLVGMELLLALQQLDVVLRRCPAELRKEIWSAFRNATQVHPNSLSLHVE